MNRHFEVCYIYSKLGKCNIYNKKNNNIILYLGLKNTTKIKQKFVLNKKNYNPIFFSGKSGNNLKKPLQNNELFLTTCIKKRQFPYHSYHFSVWHDKLPALFYKDFLKKHTYLINPDFVFHIPLISLIFNEICKYLTNGLSLFQPTSEFRPPPKRLTQILSTAL